MADKLGLTELIVNVDGGVAVATINRAKKYNTFSKVLAEDLIKAFDYFDRDDSIRVVIVTAEDTAPAYCAGADISGGWGTLFDRPDEQKEGDHAHRDTGGTVTLAIFRCRKITIAAINGHAAGVGVTALQLPFDFRFVWAGAKIAMPFVRRGIPAEAASTYLLPRLVGQAKATALVLSGATYKPTSPLLADLYFSVLPTRTEVFPAALKFATELAGNTSQTAVAVTKALLWHGADNIEEQHLLDSRGIKTLGAAPDAAEGAKAFIDRRQVQFKDKLSEFPNWMPWWREVDVKHRKSKL